MSKVLLIYENYTELTAAQFMLQKVGFDCIAISTEFGTAEQVVSFNPDVVVAYGKGGKVTTVGVGKRLKEMPRWVGKSVLIFASNHQPKPVELIKIRMDVVLEAPVENVRLLQVLAKLTGQDDQVLIEKLLKMMNSDFAGGKSSEKIYVGGSAEAQAAQAAQAAPAKVSNFTAPIEKEREEVSTGTPSAFDDLNRRELERKNRQRSQFSLSPEAERGKSSDKNPVISALVLDPGPAEKSETGFKMSPAAATEKVVEKTILKTIEKTVEKNSVVGSPLDREPSVETRFGNLQEKENSGEPKKSLKLELKNTIDVPIDKQVVDWSEMENQLFRSPKAPSTGSKEAVTNSQSNSQFPIKNEGIPSENSMNLNFGQQLRDAEQGLIDKMKSYQQLSKATVQPLAGSVLKKTSVRKAQIELMKSWKQDELEKQDGLRREFTNALFRKK